MESYSKIEDNPHLVRDNFSRGIINTDTNAYNNYMQRKESKMKDKLELVSLKNEVTELKNLVKDLINKIGN
jgi:hypothetical protein